MEEYRGGEYQLHDLHEILAGVVRVENGIFSFIYFVPRCRMMTMTASVVCSDCLHLYVSMCREKLASVFREFLFSNEVQHSSYES